MLKHRLTGRRVKIDDWLVLVYQHQTKAALDWLQQAWERGVQPRPFLLLAIARLRQVLLQRLGVAKGEDIAALDQATTVKSLLQRLVAAAGDIKTAGIDALPVELAVVEWGGTGEVVPPPAPTKKPMVKNQELLSKWPKVLEAIRPLNHSLEALLRATEPIGFDQGFLLVRVFYQFHKDRLEEDRYRLLVEQTASKILVMPVKIKLVLTEKPMAEELISVGDQDIIKTAEEVFGIAAEGGD